MITAILILAYLVVGIVSAGFVRWLWNGNSPMSGNWDEYGPDTFVFVAFWPVTFVLAIARYSIHSLCSWVGNRNVRSPVTVFYEWLKKIEKKGKGMKGQK